jgi:hypothetical protein
MEWVIGYLGLNKTGQTATRMVGRHNHPVQENGKVANFREGEAPAEPKW